MRGVSLNDATASSSCQRTSQNDAAPGAVQPQITVDGRGSRFVTAHDPESRVTTNLQTGPLEHITDPRLLEQGITAHRRLLPSDGEVEMLFPSFKTRPQPRKFFTIGKVFLTLWVEPAGESKTAITKMERGVTTGRYGESVHSKVRRFVVIREGNTYCSALPIVTYGQQGVGKPGVNKSEHAIVFTGKDPPVPLPTELPQRGETGMRSEPIRINPDDPSDKLDPVSRIDFGKVYTVLHNVKVRSMGEVHPKYMSAIRLQFGNVWRQHSSASPHKGIRVTLSGGLDVIKDESDSGENTEEEYGEEEEHRGNGDQRMHAGLTERRGPGELRRAGEGPALTHASIEAQVRVVLDRLRMQGYTSQEATQIIKDRLESIHHRRDTG